MESRDRYEEKSHAAGKGKGVPADPDVQTRGSAKKKVKEMKFGSKKLWNTLFPPSSVRQHGSRSCSEPILLGKPSSNREEILKEEAFGARAQKERGASASPIFFADRQGIESGVWRKGLRRLVAKRLRANHFLKKIEKDFWAEWGSIFVVLQSRFCLLVQKSEVESQPACSNLLLERFNPFKSKPKLPSEVSNLVTVSQGDDAVSPSASSKLKAYLPGKWLKCVRF
ncbi:hypothetical protein CK203_012731 [Vitis vinifera]|uniref:Uncharacterized protein n=1 Tax=Vitis vinifera TaxID=29760 RepID=A0A438KMW3_VITVI|nr:hypothetical protein CK203_012731 [Vitis vinifera]